MATPTTTEHKKQKKMTWAEWNALYEKTDKCDPSSATEEIHKGIKSLRFVLDDSLENPSEYTTTLTGTERFAYERKMFALEQKFRRQPAKKAENVSTLPLDTNEYANAIVKQHAEELAKLQHAQYEQLARIENGVRSAEEKARKIGDALDADEKNLGAAQQGMGDVGRKLESNTRKMNKLMEENHGTDSRMVVACVAGVAVLGTAAIVASN